MIFFTAVHYCSNIPAEWTVMTIRGNIGVYVKAIFFALMKLPANHRKIKICFMATNNDNTSLAIKKKKNEKMILYCLSTTMQFV